MGVQYILKRENAYLFYMHPWEIDHDQPIVKEAPKHLRFMHYTNLHKTLPKLLSLVESLKDCRFITCQQYITENCYL